MTFGPEFWAWVRWRDKGGPRPPGIRRKIPKAWWARYLIHRGKPRPKPELGVFADSGVQFVNPGTGPLGPVEHMRGVAQAGYAYVSFEVFDGTNAKDWTIWHREAERNYLRQLPWARCRVATDVIRLCEIARDWQQPPIVNLEDEANTTLPPHVVADTVKRHWGGAYCVQTLAILYDAVDYRPLNAAGVVCALEAYANEIPRFADYAYLVKRAAADFDRVILSPGHYPWPPGSGQYPPRSLYAACPKPWLLWIGDGVTNWNDWRAPT